MHMCIYIYKIYFPIPLEICHMEIFSLENRYIYGHTIFSVGNVLLFI